MQKRNRKAYVVTGSEDGVIAVADSAIKAATMALDYVTHCQECTWNAEERRVLGMEILLTRHASISTAELRGVAACSGSVCADVDVFDMNYGMGKNY